ncbi:MAG: BspA family leucine-rich repeat surface protein, partial [Thermoplasmata archaeon]
MIEPKTNDELKDIIKTHVLNKKILLNEIDVSNLTDLSGVFSHFEFKYEYGSIENWNVSNVRNFHSMFYKAKNLWFD